jgi:glyoxylase-like metal-dependent hydrolase (beta-lactamase superfamily II)
VAEAATPSRRRSTADLVYPFPQAPAANGSVVEVAPGILWARMPMPMALDHINVYLLREPDGWTVVDTGLNTAQVQTVWARVIAEHFEGLPLKRIVCTHSHYDHCGQAAWLSESHGNAPLHMTFGEYFQLRGLRPPPPGPAPVAHMDFYQRAGMAVPAIERMLAALSADPFTAPVPPTFQRMRDGDRLDIGGRSWEVVVGEGHSPEHACLYCAEDRILLAGDQLLPRISSNVAVTSIEPEANPLQLWIRSLDRLDRLAPDTLVLPSHQGVFRGLHARVEDLRAHHQHQFDLLCDTLARCGPSTAVELLDVQFPNRRHPMDDLLGLGETLAHLSWLTAEGTVQRELHPDGVHRYSMRKNMTHGDNK